MSSMKTKYKHPKTHPVFRRVKTSRLSAYKVTALVAVLVGGLISIPPSLWASPKSNTAVSSSSESLRDGREPLVIGSTGKLAKMASAKKVSAAAEATAPAPTKIDRCDNDQDYFVTEDNGYDYYDANWNWYRPGEWHSTNGKLAVDLMAMDSNGAMHDIRLVFTDETCPPEAANIYSAAVGECFYPASSYTRVTAKAYNVADATSRSIPRIEVTTYRVADGYRGLTNPVIIEDIPDGEQRTALIEENSMTGLLPGTWRIDFKRNGTRVGQVKIFVPSCGHHEPPKNDPGVDDPEPPRVTKPRAELWSVFTRSGSVTAKVKLDNRKVSKANLFKVKRIYNGKIQKVVKNRVAKHRAETVNFYRIKKGTRIKVFYKTSSGWEIILNRLVKRPGTS